MIWGDQEIINFFQGCAKRSMVSGYCIEAPNQQGATKRDFLKNAACCDSFHVFFWIESRKHQGSRVGKKPSL